MALGKGLAEARELMDRPNSLRRLASDAARNCTADTAGLAARRPTKFIYQQDDSYLHDTKLPTACPTLPDGWVAS